MTTEEETESISPLDEVSEDIRHKFIGESR